MLESKKKKVIIFGCGGHSRSVADILLSNSSDYELLFVDDNAREGETIYGFPVVSEFESADEFFFYGIGDNIDRKKKYEVIGSANLISIISNNSYIGNEAKIGRGCFVGNYCHIGPYVNIGDNTIINNGASVDHEVVIGSHCHIGPNSTISGRSVIGDLVFLGVGATVRDKVKICSNVTIGAGAVVVKDIAEPGVYVGIPAIKIK